MENPNIESQNRLDSLQDTLFELMENISSVEESLEQFKTEIKSEAESLKTTLDDLKADFKSKAPLAKSTQNKKASSDLTRRFKKLEANINTIIDSGVLDAISKKLNAKMLIKKEIRRYQFMIMFVLSLVGIGIVGFFYFNLATTQENLIALICALVPFIIALFIINKNLALSLNEERRIRNTQSEISIESHTIDMPKIADDADNVATVHPIAQHREKEIRNTFD